MKENPFASNPLEKNKSLKSIHDQSNKTGGNLLTGKNLQQLDPKPTRRAMKSEYQNPSKTDTKS